MITSFNAPLEMLNEMEIVEEAEAAKMKSFLGAGAQSGVQNTMNNTKSDAMGRTGGSMHSAASAGEKASQAAEELND